MAPPRHPTAPVAPDAPLLGAVGPAWVEVDLDAITWNVGRVRSAVAPAQVCAVVKADAYGHGAVESARAIVAAGAEMLGVSTLPEALELRAGGIDAPILVFTPLFPSDADLVAAAAATPTVVSLESAVALSRAAQGEVLPVHVKVDTGMGRYGVSHQDLPAFLKDLETLPGIRLAGVYTHFARPGGAAKTQLDRFLRALAASEPAVGQHAILRHAAASSTICTLPEAHLDMVRAGNLLYGMRPAAGGDRLADLRPAWRLRVVVGQARTLPPGSRVGYGAEAVVRRAVTAATLPIGFADGLGTVPASRLERPGPLLRALGRALLRAAGIERLIGIAAGSIEFSGRSVPVLGRMGMQQTTVDVSAVPDVKTGTVATVHCRPSAASARLPRVYLRDGLAWRARTPAGSFDLDSLAPVAAASE